MNCALRCWLSLNRQRRYGFVEAVLTLATLARTEKQHGGFQLSPEPQLRLKRLHLHQGSDVAAKGKQFALESFDVRLHGFSPVG